MEMIDDDDDKALFFFWVLPSDALCLMFIYMYMFLFLISSQLYFPSALIRFNVIFGVHKKLIVLHTTHSNAEWGKGVVVFNLKVIFLFACWFA